jgi:hypothetical protein
VFDHKDLHSIRGFKVPPEFDLITDNSDVVHHEHNRLVTLCIGVTSQRLDSGRRDVREHLCTSLLMPEEEVRAADKNDLSVVQMQLAFGVFGDAMENRLSYLNLR